ncbi:MAG: ribosome assembly RNA-binding protein YhbY [Clostridiales bacterium]|nr:ribosome assembly RNA-binding protein YhbY [Clostridiales bacterium]
MLRGKQRSFLKSKANTLKPILQIGKEGITEQVIEQIDKMLNDHELIKVNVLSSNELDSKEAAIQICDALTADFISALGNKFVVYRESRLKPRDERIKLPE